MSVCVRGEDEGKGEEGSEKGLTRQRSLGLLHLCTGRATGRLPWRVLPT